MTINCGNKDAKNIMAFGFDAEVINPCKYNLLNIFLEFIS
jgi:hypothetical protein